MFPYLFAALLLSAAPLVLCATNPATTPLEQRAPSFAFNLQVIDAAGEHGYINAGNVKVRHQPGKVHCLSTAGSLAKADTFFIAEDGFLSRYQRDGDFNFCAAHDVSGQGDYLVFGCDGLSQNSSPVSRCVMLPNPYAADGSQILRCKVRKSARWGTNTASTGVCLNAVPRREQDFELKILPV